MAKVFTKILTFLLVAAVLVSGYELEKKLNSYRLEKTNKVELSREVKEVTDTGKKINWEKLRERNPDVVGWIELPDSAIDYPVVQGEDNEYYLHRDIDRNYIFDGSIYVDAACEHPFKDANTVVYGHKMRSGAMFADLKKYADKDYWKDHGTIGLYTPEAAYDLKVVACTRDDAYSDLYRIIDEDVNPDETEGSEETCFTKSDFLDLVRKKAIAISNEPFDESDTYITLSTCVYSDGDERQQVICTVNEKPVKTVKKTVTTVKKASPAWFNRFLVAQILIAIIGIAVILALIWPRKKRK